MWQRKPLPQSPKQRGARDGATVTICAICRGFPKGRGVGYRPDLGREIRNGGDVMNDLAHHANLRDGGNLPARPYRWTYAHTAALIVSGLLVMMFAILGGW